MKEEEIRPKEIYHKYLALSRLDAKKFDRSKFNEVECISCGALYHKEKFTKDNFTYTICSECNSLYCNPRPSEQTLNMFYQNSRSSQYWFEEFLPKVEEVRREKIFRKKARLLRDYLHRNNLSFQNLCDCGAGSGLFLEELANIFSNKEFYAIEPGKVSSNIIKEKGFTVLQKRVEDSAEWSNKFDFVVSLEVLEHVYNPFVYLNSLRELLTDNGSCIITTLGYEGFDIQILGENSNSISPPHHLNFPSLAGFEKLFKRAGFSSVEITTPGLLDVDIVLNSGCYPEFMDTLKKRGETALIKFQEFLIEFKLSSHVWIFARK